MSKVARYGNFPVGYWKNVFPDGHWPRILGDNEVTVTFSKLLSASESASSASEAYLISPSVLTEDSSGGAATDAAIPYARVLTDVDGGLAGGLSSLAFNVALSDLLSVSVQATASALMARVVSDNYVGVGDLLGALVENYLLADVQAAPNQALLAYITYGRTASDSQAAVAASLGTLTEGKDVDASLGGGAAMASTVAFTRSLDWSFSVHADAVVEAVFGKNLQFVAAGRADTGSFVEYEQILAHIFDAYRISTDLPPNERTYCILAEDRTYVIAAEDRTYVIAFEDRSFLVLRESDFLCPAPFIELSAGTVEGDFLSNFTPVGWYPIGYLPLFSSETMARSFFAGRYICIPEENRTIVVKSQGDCDPCTNQ